MENIISKNVQQKVSDYHNFCTIDTPKEQRRKWRVGDIWINEATCEICGDTIRSHNLHDYVTCSCGNVAVDGGSWYAKRSFQTDKYVDNIVMFNDGHA